MQVHFDLYWEACQPIDTIFLCMLINNARLSGPYHDDDRYPHFSSGIKKDLTTMKKIFKVLGFAINFSQITWAMVRLWNLPFMESCEILFDANDVLVKFRKILHRVTCIFLFYSFNCHQHDLQRFFTKSSPWSFLCSSSSVKFKPIFFNLHPWII